MLGCEVNAQVIGGFSPLVSDCDTGLADEYLADELLKYPAAAFGPATAADIIQLDLASIAAVGGQINQLRAGT